MEDLFFSSEKKSHLEKEHRMCISIKYHFFPEKKLCPGSNEKCRDLRFRFVQHIRAYTAALQSDRPALDTHTHTHISRNPHKNYISENFVNDDIPL